jgi:hypothetical protein
VISSMVIFTEYQGPDDPELLIIIDEIVSLCPEYEEQAYKPEPPSKRQRLVAKSVAEKNCCKLAK